MEPNKIGTTRDRTEQFFEYRKKNAEKFKTKNKDLFTNNSNGSDNGAEGLLEGIPKSDTKNDIEMAELKGSTPEWFKLFEEIYDTEINIGRRRNQII